MISKIVSSKTFDVFGLEKFAEILAKKGQLSLFLFFKNFLSNTIVVRHLDSLLHYIYKMFEGKKNFDTVYYFDDMIGTYHYAVNHPMKPLRVAMTD